MYEDQPFATQNKPLAFSLLLAGCTLAPAEQGGPAINRYTIGFVRNRRDCQGMHLEEAAKDLYTRKIEGHVSWLFVKNATFDKAINAWEEIVDKLRQAASQEIEPKLPDIPTEVVMQVLCIRQNSVEEFNKLAFVNRMSQWASTAHATLRDEPMKDNKGETMPGLKKTVAKGGGLEWSIFGSDEMKKHLGVWQKY